ncbi:MAG: arylsulfotransferase family protein [Solirubrobacteraceae bacterium]|jgi:hypothetical protein
MSAINTPAESDSHRLTRRALLRSSAFAAGSIVLAGYLDGDQLRRSFAPAPTINDVLTSAAPQDPQFHSRPDLRIPALSIATTSERVAPGLIFFAPYNAPKGQQAGAVIADNTGQTVWQRPLPYGDVITNLRVQSYRDRPVLTWWEGQIVDGHGVGHYLIADERYRPLHRVQAGNGLQADLHEFLITSRGTALLTAYTIGPMDLSSVGGPTDGTIQDAIFQEIDLASGRVLFEWRSLDHLSLEESYYLPVYTPWDYVHINSLDIDRDGNFLVSSRNTHTVYKIDRRSGAIIWRLGGKQNQFAFGANSAFAWQHDARRQRDGTLTLFDNEGPPGGGVQSRGIVLALDERSRKASLLREYRHPSPLLATSQGSLQVLPDGNVFIGWGAEPFVSEFTADGELLFDAQLGADYLSYRAFRLPWAGQGEGTPTLAAERNGHRTLAYISWNGDTRTRFWVLLGGRHSNSLSPLAARPRDDFETVVVADGHPRYLAARAIDENGNVLGQSETLRV